MMTMEEPMRAGAAYLPAFLEDYAYNEAEKTAFLHVSEVLSRYPDEVAPILAAHRVRGARIKDTEEARRALAARIGVSFYALNFVVLVWQLPETRAAYEAAGIPTEVFHDTMEDLLYKVRECEEVKGECGIFVEFWYRGFFDLTIFKLGRLEFERRVYHGDGVKIDDFSLQEGDPILGIHIPSCGTFSRELREESYRRAYAFFPDLRKDGVLPMDCHSWLLYPENRKILATCRNVVGFLDDFDFLTGAAGRTFHDAWRVFGKDATDLSALPYRTAMQRAVLGHLASGGQMGTGHGIRLQTADR